MEVIVTSRRAGCAVWSFSLLSSRMFADVELNPTPLLLEGSLTQPCTSAVRSSVTYCPASEAVKLLLADPREGMEL